MPKGSPRLAASLSALQELQEGKGLVFRSDDLSRADRERLVRNNWVQPIIRGWLMSKSPATQESEQTPWTAAFWPFCGQYCEGRFGDEWHLSANDSLLRHAESLKAPQQLVIHSPAANNDKLDLPFGSSFFNLKAKGLPGRDLLCVREGIRMFTPEAALVKASGAFLQDNPVDVRVVAGAIGDASGLLAALAKERDGGAAAGARLVDAFRRAGKEGLAEALERAGHGSGAAAGSGRASGEIGVLGSVRSSAPMADRVRSLWDLVRGPVLDRFPEPPGMPASEGGKAAFFKAMSDQYVTDAYHSLSIEGYRVTRELIQRVQSGDWDPNARPQDKDDHDALAARGYWLAFQAVQESIHGIVEGGNAGRAFRRGHGVWHERLFSPFVEAGIYDQGGMRGFRNQPVYLRGSRHVPPREGVLLDAMSALYEQLEVEGSPAVRAVAGHWLFGHIHPHRDGNGRLARFLMNAMLASGGYPWAIVRVEDRVDYLASLEAASVENKVERFVDFIAGRVEAATLDMAARGSAHGAGEEGAGTA